MITGKRPIDNLGILDSGLGLLASLCTIKEQICKEPREPYDTNDLIIRARQIMGLLESGCGSEYDCEEQTLCNLTKPDFLLFKEKISSSNIPDYKKRVKEKLDPFFTECTPPSSNNSCWIVKPKQKAEKPKIHNKIEVFLNLPNKIANQRPMSHMSTIHNDQNVQSRMILTNELIQEFINEDIKIFANKKLPKSKNFINPYNPEIIFPLVGTTRGSYAGQTVLYVMTCHKTKKSISLNQANIDIDNIIPYLIKNHKGIRNIVKKCGFLCKPEGGYRCIMRNLLARPANSDFICVLTYITFLPPMMMGLVHVPAISNLYQYVNEKLKGWEVWCDLHQNYSFRFDDKTKNMEDK